MCRVLGGWECLSCGYSSKYTTDVRRHIESKHVEGLVDLACTICGHLAANVSTYKRHYLFQHATKL
jgi:hypothetical protein